MNESRSNGRLSVGDLATRLGNVVEDIDVNYKFSGGAGDVDILTSSFNVEVKSGGKMKLTQSLKNLEYARAKAKGTYYICPRRPLLKLKRQQVKA